MGETVAQLPANFRDLDQVRVFLNTLVQRLDSLLGYRALPDETLSALERSLVENQIDKPVEEELTDILQRLTSAENGIDSLQTSVNSINSTLNTIQDGTTVSDSSYTAPNVSGSYVESEVQSIANGVENVSNTLDSLLAVLRNTGIIS